MYHTTFLKHPELSSCIERLILKLYLNLKYAAWMFICVPKDGLG